MPNKPINQDKLQLVKISDAGAKTNCYLSIIGPLVARTKSVLFIC